MDENQKVTPDTSGGPVGDTNPDDLANVVPDEKQPGQGDASTGAQEVDWQEKYRNLERDYTRKSQRLSRLERDVMQKQSSTAPEVKVTPEEYWTAPAETTARVVESVLSKYEQKRQQEQQLEKYVEQWAEDNQIPKREMNNLLQQVMDAANNPDELMQLLVDVHKARNASQEIQRAQRTIEETTRKNARAVTAQGGSTQPEPGGFSLEDFKTWSREKREAYLRQTVGVKEDY